MATSTVEDYLKTIWLEQRRAPDEPVSTGRLAAALEIAPGTATAMVKTLDASGLLHHEPYSGVRLTEAGESLALHVLRRHRLIELFLVQVMGMDWSEVHAEADALEHAVSDRLVARIDEILGRPEFDPHGDPIPSADGEVAELDLPTLLACPLDEPVRVARVTDQSGDFLRLLSQHDLRPGSVVRVVERAEAADRVVLAGSDQAQVSLGYRAAAKVLVRKVETAS